VEYVIRPERKLHSNWREVWAFRELFYFLAWRDVKVRYKQTLVGASWAIFQPFVMMVVFTVFFNHLAGISAGDDVPYPVFVYSGLLFWNLFTQTVSRASDSLVNNQAVVTKVYFPRLILPLSAPVVSFADFLAALVIFAGMLVYYGILPGLEGVLLFLPAIGITLVAACGLGLALAALNVKYRDVRQALPFFLQVLLFLTPVIYPVSLVPSHLRFLLYLNPMTGVITAMRAGVTGAGSVNWLSLAVSLGMALLLLACGLEYFRRREREFADIV
jgi:lipopolysaccharide transport system permease protein